MTATRTSIAISAVAPLAALGLVLAGPAAPGTHGAASPDNAGPPKTSASASTAPGLPMKWDERIPVDVQSTPVEWRDTKFQLVGLGSIQFKLDKQTGVLTAEVQGGVTTFDDVSYEVSAAVLDASGRLLGTARSPCRVSREWEGKPLREPRTIVLDFGASRGYVKAATFMLSLSEPRVLTPDEWPKK